MSMTGDTDKLTDETGQRLVFQHLEFALRAVLFLQYLLIE